MCSSENSSTDRRSLSRAEKNENIRKWLSENSSRKYDYQYDTKSGRGVIKNDHFVIKINQKPGAYKYPDRRIPGDTSTMDTEIDTKRYRRKIA